MRKRQKIVKAPHVSSRKTAVYRKMEHSSDEEEKFNPSSSKSETDNLSAANLDQDSDIGDSEEVHFEIKSSNKKPFFEKY
ncbi:hypothetical protein TNCT_170021 [Trichonephila clavata]|uniref:Uncharacterized protein n=1 Tax=Trichonephila clavata TaxID=2740835 RepID=A0A8X6EXP8_TRICU|nr:hypothetical protein TNCT_170021 [Trichonephila clavata]